MSTDDADQTPVDAMSADDAGFLREYEARRRELAAALEADRRGDSTSGRSASVVPPDGATMTHPLESSRLEASAPLDLEVELRDGGGARAYRQVMRAITTTPWAILPAVYGTIREIVALRVEGRRLSAAEVAERIDAGPGSRQPLRAGGGLVAVVPLTGVIIPRANLLAEISGGTSLQRFGAALDAAARDEEVESILIDIDSPGGSVDLVPETAAKIRAAAARKPVVAVANTLAASAAYWLGSQAGEFVVSPSALVGSIGVIAEHVDVSAALEGAGVKVSLIYAGRFKSEGHPAEPLTDDARAAVQSLVDEFYGRFVADVAKGRGVKTKAVREGFGQGRVVSARTAVSQGMADRVESFDDALARLAKGKGRVVVAAARPEDDQEPDGEAVAAEIEEAHVGAAAADGLDLEYALALERERT